MNACRDTSVHASGADPGGALNSSSCHTIHGPPGIRSGSTVSIRSQPISGRAARRTSPPRTWARSWPPKHTPSTGTPASTAEPTRRRSWSIHSMVASGGDWSEPMMTKRAKESVCGSADGPWSARYAEVANPSSRARSPSTPGVSEALWSRNATWTVIDASPGTPSRPAQGGCLDTPHRVVQRQDHARRQITVLPGHQADHRAVGGEADGMVGEFHRPLGHFDLHHSGALQGQG